MIQRAERHLHRLFHGDRPGREDGTGANSPYTEALAKRSSSRASSWRMPSRTRAGSWKAATSDKAGALGEARRSPAISISFRSRQTSEIASRPKPPTGRAPSPRPGAVAEARRSSRRQVPISRRRSRRFPRREGAPPAETMKSRATASSYSSAAVPTMQGALDRFHAAQGALPQAPRRQAAGIRQVPLAGGRTSFASPIGPFADLDRSEEPFAAA